MNVDTFWSHHGNCLWDINMARLLFLGVCHSKILFCVSSEKMNDNLECLNGYVRNKGTLRDGIYPGVFKCSMGTFPMMSI